MSKAKCCCSKGMAWTWRNEPCAICPMPGDGMIFSHLVVYTNAGKCLKVIPIFETFPFQLDLQISVQMDMAMSQKNFRKVSNFVC